MTWREPSRTTLNRQLMRCRIPTSSSVEAARSKTEADPNQLLIRATIASRPSYSSSPCGSKNRAWASLAREATSLSKSRAASSSRNLCEVAPAATNARSASAAGMRLCSIISITSRSPLGGIVRPPLQIVKRSIEYLTHAPETGIVASDDRAGSEGRALRSVRPGGAGRRKRTPGGDRRRAGQRRAKRRGAVAPGRHVGRQHQPSPAGLEGGRTCRRHQGRDARSVSARLAGRLPVLGGLALVGG